MISPVPRKIVILFCAIVLATLAITVDAQTTNLTEHKENNWTSKGNIVVSIKPLYSLVAQLTKGIEQPVLLMAQSQSPHHYNLPPSERRLLSNAKLVIWLGPQMEASISKILKQNTTTAIAVLETKGLSLLSNRGKYSDDPDSHYHHTVDPHVWLSSRNVIIFSQHISQQLITLDPKNTKKYQTNFHLLKTKIEDTDRFIKTTLTKTEKPFMVYHDAYQYFEEEYDLYNAAIISADHESTISLKHLRDTLITISEKQIQCLAYQPPRPAIIDTLVNKSGINVTMLDILGTDLKDDEDAWFAIMRSLAVNLEHCLQ